jgi:hypothetical protein
VITELPNDPALPGLVAIRAAGLAGAIPALGLDHGPVQLQLHRYHPGRRAALEARAGQRHFAIKLYAEDPWPEVETHEALAAAGLAGDAGVRVPPLLAWDRALQVMVIGWLDGPSVAQLIQAGQGKRAGTVAASWFRHAASLTMKLGSSSGAARMLKRTRKWAAAVAEAEPALQPAANEVADMLERTQPVEGAPRLVHGGLYADHVLDLGDGPGVIDWGRCGQGPLELDAGVIIATMWRLGFRDGAPVEEAGRAEEALLEGTAGLLDPGAINWYRAAMLLRFAKKADPRTGEWPDGARHALLDEAASLVQDAKAVCPE